MKELEQKADEMISKSYQYLSEVYKNQLKELELVIEDGDLIHTAIISVNHTIETLERVYCREWNNVKDLYNEQIELKKILEGRL